MKRDLPCAEIRLLLPELALGTLTGEDRARALSHLTGCQDCRRELGELSEVGDELLLLAPKAEPPLGFESRVLERLGAGRRTARPRSRRWVAIAAAAVLAAAVAASATFFAGRHDRELADDYRRTLTIARGDYFAAKPLKSTAGAAMGSVFGYQGSPSWVFCVVRSGSSSTTYDIEVTDKNGDSWKAGEMYAHEGRGTWAQPLGIDLHDVKKIRFVDRSTGKTLTAQWDA